jgi:hypothetical protein
MSKSLKMNHIAFNIVRDDDEQKLRTASRKVEIKITEEKKEGRNT